MIIEHVNESVMCVTHKGHIISTARLCVSHRHRIDLCVLCANVQATGILEDVFVLPFECPIMLKVVLCAKLYWYTIIFVLGG